MMKKTLSTEYDLFIGSDRKLSSNQERNAQRITKIIKKVVGTDLSFEVLPKLNKDSDTPIIDYFKKKNTSDISPENKMKLISEFEEIQNIQKSLMNFNNNRASGIEILLYTINNVSLSIYNEIVKPYIDERDEINIIEKYCGTKTITDLDSAERFSLIVKTKVKNKRIWGPAEVSENYNTLLKLALRLRSDQNIDPTRDATIIFEVFYLINRFCADILHRLKRFKENLPTANEYQAYKTSEFWDITVDLKHVVDIILRIRQNDINMENDISRIIKDFLYNTRIAPLFRRFRSMRVQQTRGMINSTELLPVPLDRMANFELMLVMLGSLDKYLFSYAGDIRTDIKTEGDKIKNNFNAEVSKTVTLLRI